MIINFTPRSKIQAREQVGLLLLIHFRYIYRLTPFSRILVFVVKKEEMNPLTALAQWATMARSWCARVGKLVRMKIHEDVGVCTCV